MNNDRIDKIGVAALVDYFCMGGYVNPHIAFDDKIPVWDGTLDIHKSEDSLSSADIDFVVDVQVKSSEVKTFENETTHKIEVNNLKNYLSRGGTLLAKVLIRGSERKILFSYLGKIEINKYLDNCTDGQEKITIKFIEAPSDRKELISELRSIHLQGKHNLLSVDELAKRSDYTLHLTVGPMPKNSHPILWMATHATDVLVSLPESKDPFYLEAGPSYFSTSHDVSEPVSISTVKYFDSFRFITQKNGVEFHIGNFFHIIPQGNGISNVTVTPNSTDLITYIKELEFVLGLYKYKEFSLGSLRQNIDGNVFDANKICGINEELKFCNRLISLFRLWGINKPQICVRELSEETINLVDQLYQMYYTKIPIMADEEQIPYRNFVIGKYNIVFLIGFESSGKRCLIDLSLCRTARFTNPTNQEAVFPVIIYLFTKNIFPDNFSYSNLSEILEQCNSTPDLSEIANQSTLFLINAFDKNQDERYINCAMEILNWCYTHEANEESKNIYRLNIIQCIKRQTHSISEDDNEFLLGFSTDNPILYFASNVLLDDKKRAEIAWKKIPLEEQEEIKNYPIYHLYRNLNTDIYEHVENEKR